MNDILITLDIDWAPDFIIDFASERLLESGVKATWFVTHSSSAVDRLRDIEFFELGIHPNFMPGSTQGETPEKIIDNLTAIVPNAFSSRSHRSFFWGNLPDLLVSREIGIEASSGGLLNLAHLTPTRLNSLSGELVRFPVFWADDHELLEETPRWDLKEYLAIPGLKIFDFHPIHLYLNSASMEPYLNLKNSYGDFTNISKDQVEKFVNNGIGCLNLFEMLIKHICETKKNYSLKDLYKEFIKS